MSQAHTDTTADGDGVACDRCPATIPAHALGYAVVEERSIVAYVCVECVEPHESTLVC